MRDRLLPVLSVLAMLPSALALPSCATILGYDDLTPRADAGSESGTDTGVVDSKVDSGPTPIHAPTRPPGDPTPSGTGKTVWFLFKRFYLGSVNHSGAKVSGAWKEWGFDLDKVCTGDKESKENIGTCRRVEGAAQDMLVDGNDCIDNNFGSHLVSLIRVYKEDFEKEANAAILAGSSTWILKLEDVDDGPNDPFVSGKLYRATPEKTGPALDGSDVRSVSSDSVIKGDLDQPVSFFPVGYIKNNVWVSGDANEFDVFLPIGAFSVPMHLVGGVMTLPLDDKHENGTTANGVLAGAIPASTLEATIKPVAIEAKFCPGTPIYVSLLKTLQQFPDLVAGAPNLQDVNVTCDALSMGVGYEVAPMQPVTTVAAPPPPPPNPCP